MERRRQENINSPDYFDGIWKNPTAREGFDRVRMEALTRRVKAGDQILDLGCGLSGPGEFCLGRGLVSQIHCVDFSKEAKRILEARHGEAVKFTLAEVTRVPLEGHQFDVVMAGELIEHIDQPLDLVEEMHRLCRPGGWVAVSTVNHECDQAQRCTYDAHVWAFTLGSLGQLFSEYFNGQAFQVGNYHCFDGQPK